MAIQDDFSLNYTTKKISHVSGSTRYTVNALYSWLMDLFDDAGQMDDTVPMSAQTPTEYTLINGWEFNADSDVGYLYGGSVVVQKATTDRDVWANFYTLGTIESDAVMYFQQNSALVASHPGYSTGHIDQLVKVVAAGADVDSRNVTVFARNNASANADLYDNFTSTASATGGRNPVPIATSPDTNDDGTGSAVVGVTVDFNAPTSDVDGDGTAESYTVTVDGGGNSTLQAYRYLKYITRRENTAAVGTSNATPGRFYRYANAAYAEAKQAPFGTYAGGKFFGARGVLLTNVSDPNNRVLIDNAGTTKTPPVSMTAVITGVAVGDRVLVARSTGSGSVLVNKSQFTLNGAHTSGMSTVVVNEAVGNDIPSTGVIRVSDTRYTYTALNRATKTFTISGTLGAAYAGAAPAYVPLIDDVAAGTSIASPAMTYVADMDVVYRVRKKGILPFENSAVVGSTGLSASAIRTTDTIAV